MWHTATVYIYVKIYRDVDSSNYDNLLGIHQFLGRSLQISHYSCTEHIHQMVSLDVHGNFPEHSSANTTWPVASLVNNNQ